MVFFSRFLNGPVACGLALALAATPLFAAQTETTAPSVEVYVDQVVPDSPETDVLPSGIEWNKPLKAGDMVLPRRSAPRAPKAPAIELQAPRLPVGELKPPVLGGTKDVAAPNLVKEQAGSTSGIMLLQGMKNALQQVGHNADVPDSKIKPQTEIKATEKGSLLSSVKTDLTPPLLTNAKSDGDVSLSAPVIDSQSGVAYEPGQEPKMLTVLKSGEKSETTSLPPAATEQPSVTDMAEAPPSLSDVVEGDAPTPSLQPEKQQAKQEEDDSFLSIFGSSVEEEPTSEKEKTAGGETSLSERVTDSELQKTEEPVEAKAEETSCEPSVTSWTRDCQAAGYPAYFSGEIVGETRIACPSGESREVWISNSCAAAFVDGSKKEVAPQESGAASPQAAETAAPAPVIIQNDGQPVDASCGVANGLPALTKPAGSLCVHGAPSEVQEGEGPWRWMCRGLNGGMSVSCAAPVAIAKPVASQNAAKGTDSTDSQGIIEDGQCGLAAESGHETVPVNYLCAKGTPSRVNGGGPWSWACGGLNGGQAAACTAPKKTEGVCGVAGQSGVDGMPMKDLCASGYASAVTGEGPWYWTCSGLHGGMAATCNAAPKENAVCGKASTRGHREEPKEGLCSIGESSVVAGQGPWRWTCHGLHDGVTVSCEAPVSRDGVCGAANGGQYLKAPEKGLCAEGRSSLVTGMGPWNWTCSGIDGGETVSCTAALGTEEDIKDAVACGESAESLAFAPPSTHLCAAGKASAVNGSGPWTWSCSDEAGHNVACMTLAASEGACGEAANVASAFAPSDKLCASGTPGEVKSDNKKTAWQWDCKGETGGESVACSAPISQSPVALKRPVKEDSEAMCGHAAGRGFEEKPETGLCAVGKASEIKGRGPWTWSCATSGKGKTETTCEAVKIVDGACGKANGSIQKAAPESGLCVAGSATEVVGKGPWMWTCLGIAGGNSASCSALSQTQTKVDGLCGKAANAPMTETPTASLCDSGSPSTVYGEGPWTWTCSGLNGGIASTCKASKVVPQAPPPPGPKVNGLCGPSNGVASLSQPKEGLCSTGTATALSGDGPWNWGCLGLNGGMTVSCTAPLMPPAPIVGTCGASSGVPSLTAPSGSLCASGISSAVSGKGPWTWSCSGTNGGGAVACVAPIAGKGASGPLPSLTTPSSSSLATPSLDNGVPPLPAPLGLVTPTLPTSSRLPPTQSEALPNRVSSKPSAMMKKEASVLAIQDIPVEIPEAAPSLPKGVSPLNPPSVRDSLKPTPGLKSPVLDSEGKPISGERIVLEPEVSSVGFAEGSDQLSKESVQIAEKLVAILRAHNDARITLVAYAGTSIDRSPREARRLSLARALTLRDYFVSKGIPSSRVDVRPMGANVAVGDMDRVDVQVN